jgi:hypothetical protein
MPDDIITRVIIDRQGRATGGTNPALTGAPPACIRPRDNRRQKDQERSFLFPIDILERRCPSITHAIADCELHDNILVVYIHTYFITQ